MGHERLHCWFELSYASFLVLPRVLMYEMPDKWQEKMAKLLEQYDDTFTNKPDIGCRVLFTDLSGKLIKGPKWMLNYRYPNKKEINKIK